MNYVPKYVRIKSNWFDMVTRTKKNTYTKIDGYKGLYLYLQLYKFKIYNQEYEDTFITSISFLRKETGYSTEEIFELLKKMKTAKVIKILNISRWDYLIDEKGNIRDKDILQIVATDLPTTIRKPKTDVEGKPKVDKNNQPIMIDSPATENDFFIPINIEMFDLYKQAKMYGTGAKGEKIEKYIALYCLIQKWSNNLERKMNMQILKIANVLGIDKDYIHKMIYSLNRNYFLYSTKRTRKVAKGYYFEHHICANASSYEKFKEQVKADCDKLVARYDKKNNKKNNSIEESLPVVGEFDDSKEEQKQSNEPKLAFGTKKAQVKKEHWGQYNSFDQAPIESYDPLDDEDYGWLDEIEE